jgi:UDP-N-acetyl-D-galactosamine dehydrogenase
LLPRVETANSYAAVVLAVAHEQFKPGGAYDTRALTMSNGVVYDIKGVLPKEQVDGRL